MNTSEQAREHLAKQRLDEEHLRQNLKERSVEAVSTHHESEMSSESRELATDRRQQSDRRQDNMLMRSEVHMNPSEQAREHLAQQRLDEEHLRQKLKERSVETVSTHQESEISAESRELATDRRQQSDRRQDSMLMRAEAEIEAAKVEAAKTETPDTRQ